MAIDYAAANKLFRNQKSALTRAKNTGDPLKVCKAVKKAVQEWNGPICDGAWPDNWHNWNIAYGDAVNKMRWDDHPEVGNWPDVIDISTITDWM